jgi:GntR family transcriptional regulator, transcriptional repressor for pyruvate dehydrogenase complex
MGMMTRAVSSMSGENAKNLTQDVREMLLGWIREGNYPAGSQLPSVPELVSRLSVSRTVVREALQSLVGMNLIEMRPGLGCFVKSVSPDLFVNPDLMAALLDMDTLIQVAEARRAIESAVARVAAVTATQDDFDEIAAILFRIERLSKKNQPMYTVTPAFHVAIARATHNAVMESVVSSFNTLMKQAGAVIEREQPGSAYRIGEYESHRQLLDVLESRDPTQAALEMETHITKTVDALREIRAKRS